MNINIKATNIELTEAINDYAAKRFEVITRFLQNDTTAHANVELGRTTKHHKNGVIFRAEMHIVALHKDIYVASEKIDLYAAIDAVRDEAMRRLSSSKDKHISLVRRGGVRVKNILKGIFTRGDESGNM